MEKRIKSIIKIIIFSLIIIFPILFDITILIAFVIVSPFIWIFDNDCTIKELYVGFFSPDNFITTLYTYHKFFDN